MAIEVTDNPAEFRYELHTDGELAGIMDYQRSPGELRILHTEILPEKQEHGLASQFVQTVLDGVRASGDRVRPDCPYVAHWLTKHPEYQDLVG